MRLRRITCKASRSLEMNERRRYCGDSSANAIRGFDAIARLARPEDLPKLAAFIDVTQMPRDYYYQTDSLLGTLTTAYGADAVPYVKRIIQKTDRASLRDDAGNALVSANLPETWAFIADAIENDAVYKADLMRYIGARYPDSNATQASMLALAKRLAAGHKP